MKTVIMTIIIFILFSCFSAASSGITLDRHTLLFTLRTKDNLQGITFDGHHFFATFDMGARKDRIREYSTGGKLLKQSGPINIGKHPASLDYREANGHLYVANGGSQNPLKIYEVTMGAQPKVAHELDMGKLGHSGLIAIDNVHDMMWIHTAPNDHGDITFSLCTFGGNVKRKFTIPNQGVPQGLAFNGGKLYYYTNNKISVINTNSGKVTSHITLHKKGESEGLTFANGHIAIGYHQPNRIYLLPVEN